MTGPTRTTTSTPVPKQPPKPPQLSLLSLFQRNLTTYLSRSNADAQPAPPTPDLPEPALVQDAVSHVVADVFNVTTTTYSPEDYATRSPAAEQIDWNSGELGTVTKTLSSNPEQMTRVAVELSRHGDSVTGDGESHVLRTLRKQHAYVIVSPWYPVPARFRPWWCGMGNFNVFRMLPLCFPAGGGELPSTATPPSEGIEPGVSQTAIVEHRGTVWTKNRPVDGLIALGRSSNVRATGYTEVHDETNGLLIRWCRMSTTRYHVLDGYLSWVLIYDERQHRFMYAAIGDGSHPLPYIDQLNPVLGGAMMCTKVRTLATLMRAPADRFLLTDRSTPTSVDDLVHQLDPELALRRKLLRWADLLAIPVSELRRHQGGITTED